MEEEIFASPVATPMAAGLDQADIDVVPGLPCEFQTEEDMAWMEEAGERSYFYYRSVC